MISYQFHWIPTFQRTSSLPVFLSLMVTVSSQRPSIVNRVSFPSRNFPLTALVNSPPPRKGLIRSQSVTLLTGLKQLSKIDVQIF